MAKRGKKKPSTHFTCHFEFELICFSQFPKGWLLLADIYINQNKNEQATSVLRTVLQHNAVKFVFIKNENGENLFRVAAKRTNIWDSFRKRSKSTVTRQRTMKLRGMSGSERIRELVNKYVLAWWWKELFEKGRNREEIQWVRLWWEWDSFNNKLAGNALLLLWIFHLCTRFSAGDFFRLQTGV